jgi:hypothetical protein
VQKLRNEWKALDAQHSGVPKALWDRFDRACERGYAPAARHFAELAAQRKDARKRREDFIAMAARRTRRRSSPTPLDHRAIERWLRETEHGWREGDLGSLDPGSWKKLDAKLREALAPARDALNAARDQAKAGRQALIDEVRALSAKPTERDIRRRSRRSRRAGRSTRSRCRSRSATSARCGSNSGRHAMRCSTRGRRSARKRTARSRSTGARSKN